MPKKLSEMASDELLAVAYKYAESAREWSHSEEAQRANDIAFAELLLHFADAKFAASRMRRLFKQHGTITGRIPTRDEKPYSVDDIQIDDGTGVKRSISNEEVMADEEDVDS
jgi:hypothetical protein